MNSPRGTKSDRPNTANSLVNAYNTLLTGKLATRDFIHEKVPTLYSIRLRRACFGEVEHNMKNILWKKLNMGVTCDCMKPHRYAGSEIPTSASELSPVQPMGIEIRQLSHRRASESMFLLLLIRRQNSCYSLSAVLLEVNQRVAQCSLLASFEFPNESSYTRRRCCVYFLLISPPYKQLQCFWATEAKHHHCRLGSHDRRVGCRPNHSCRDAHSCWRHQQGPLHSTKPSATVCIRQHELLTQHSATAGDELLGATKARGRRVYWWWM